MKKIAIGSDHAGFELKEKIKTHLEAKSLEVVDFGTNSDASVDYPDFGHAVANFVLKNKGLGIVMCGSGIGMSITVNRHKGIRCGLVRNSQDAKIGRLHNDLNMIALGGRITDLEIALQIVDVFLETKFEDKRHMERIKKIEECK